MYLRETVIQNILIKKFEEILYQPKSNKMTENLSSNLIPEKGRFLIEEECILGYTRTCHPEIWPFTVEAARGLQLEVFPVVLSG